MNRINETLKNRISPRWSFSHPRFPLGGALEALQLGSLGQHAM